MEILLDGVSQEIKDGEAITIHEMKTVCMTLLPSTLFHYSVVVEGENETFTINVEQEAEVFFVDSNSMVQVSFSKQNIFLENEEGDSSTEVSSNDAFSEYSSDFESDSEIVEFDRSFDLEDEESNNESCFDVENDLDFDLFESSETEQNIPSFDFLPNNDDKDLWWKKTDKNKEQDLECESDGISFEQASVQSCQSLVHSLKTCCSDQIKLLVLATPPNPTSIKKLKGITGSFSTMMRFFQKSFEEIEFNLEEIFCHCA